MSLKLKDPKKLPNQGFLFTENGRIFNEMVSFGLKSQYILVFRQDNNLPRATMSEVAEDLQNATCHRDPSLCYDSTGPLGYPASGGRMVSGCASCGGTPA